MFRLEFLYEHRCGFEGRVVSEWIAVLELQSQAEGELAILRLCRPDRQRLFRLRSM